MAVGFPPYSKYHIFLGYDVDPSLKHTISIMETPAYHKIHWKRWAFGLGGPWTQFVRRHSREPHGPGYQAVSLCGFEAVLAIGEQAKATWAVEKLLGSATWTKATWAKGTWFSSFRKVQLVMPLPPGFVLMPEIGGFPYRYLPQNGIQRDPPSLTNALVINTAGGKAPGLPGNPGALDLSDLFHSLALDKNVDSP